MTSLQNETSILPDSVEEGLDGYLFLTGGQHSIKTFFTGAGLPPPSSIDAFYRNTFERQAWCDRHGVGYAHWVFPEKLFALRHLLPRPDAILSLYLSSYAPRSDEEAALPVHYLATSDACAFKRLDTHLSTAGVIDAVEEMVRKIGFDDTGFRACMEARQKEVDFHNDLGSKCTPPRAQKERVFATPFPGVRWASNGLQGGNDGILDLLSSAKAVTNETLLIFGDSFFRQSLMPLTYFFRRIAFCRTRFFHPEMGEMIRPDRVFSGMTERYLSNVSADSEAPAFLDYPALKGTEVAPTLNFAALWAEFTEAKP